MPKRSRSDKLDSFDAAECSGPFVRAARRATYAMFFADGIGFGIWAGHIPAFKQSFELSDSSLSIVLLARRCWIDHFDAACGPSGATFWEQALHRRQRCLLGVMPCLYCLGAESDPVCHRGTSIRRGERRRRRWHQRPGCSR